MLDLFQTIGGQNAKLQEEQETGAWVASADDSDCLGRRRDFLRANDLESKRRR